MKRNYKHILFPFVLCGLMAAQTSAAPGIVKGRITDTQGKPVAQVVVTDGRNFTTTDGTGHYRMESDAERQPLVYISTPSAYKLPATDGIADRFYQFQKADSQENTCNFTLEPRETPTRRFVLDCCTASAAAPWSTAPIPRAAWSAPPPGSCVRISLTAAPPPAATPRSSNR